MGLCYLLHLNRDDHLLCGIRADVETFAYEIISSVIESYTLCHIRFGRAPVVIGDAVCCQHGIPSLSVISTNGPQPVSPLVLFFNQFNLCHAVMVNSRLGIEPIAVFLCDFFCGEFKGFTIRKSDLIRFHLFPLPQVFALLCANIVPNIALA